MTTEQEQIRMDIISQLLDYYAKTYSSQVTTERLLTEASIIEAWITSKNDLVKPDKPVTKEEPETDRAYTRTQLIKICEEAIVGVYDWENRDTPNAQVKIGKCRALLKAGCSFEVHMKPRNSSDTAVTDDKTIWLTIRWPSFGDIESGDWDDERLCSNSELFYLPTKKRLEEVNGKDWY